MGRKGQVVVIFALAIFVILGFAALVIDVGMAYGTKVQLQNAADAAAMAGAMELPNAIEAENTAEDYASFNGVPETDSKVTTPYEDDPYQIKVECSGTVNYTFARVLGFLDTEITAVAVAEKIAGDGGYAIFSGGGVKLTLNGENNHIIGGVHANSLLEVNGKNIDITGVAEATDGIDIGGTGCDIPNQVHDADHIPMEVYTANIELDPGLVDTEMSGVVFSPNKIELSAAPVHKVASLKEVIINADDLTLNHSIIAEGDIIINADNLTLNCPVIYSINGIVKINTNNSCTVNGILYSPNSNVELNPSGDPTVINGRIVGDFVKLNGPDITVDASGMSESSGGGGSSRLTH